MSSIYNSCTEGLIWLGEEDEEAEAAMRLIQIWSQDVHYNEWESLREELIAVDHLLSRPWWSRIWTVQEEFLPPKKVVLCGGQDLPWDKFVLAKDSLMEHLQMKCCQGKYFEKIVIDILDRFTLIFQSFKANPNKNFLSVAYSFRNRQASDPRDKLFALLSLVPPHDQDLVRPYYSADLQYLYTDFTIAYIRRHGSLEPLSFILDNEPNADLPSWVPDWRLPIHDISSQSGRLLRLGVFDACSGLKPNIVTSRCCNTYMMKENGLYFDTVSLVSENFSFDNHNMRLRRFCESAKLALQNSYITGESFDDAFWRTAILDTFLDGSSPNAVRASLEFIKYSQNIGLRFLDGSYVSELDFNWEFTSFLEAFSTAILHRRFFITGRGYIGIGPGRMQAGDQIYILSGGTVPLVLRRAETQVIFTPPDMSDPQPQLLHTFVGDCYVHGIMDGEYIKGRKEDLRPVYLI
jgi:hypothetical protein